MMVMGSKRAAVCALALGLALGGCDLVGPGDVEEARFRVESESSEVTVVTSTDFAVFGSADPQVPNVEFFESDTITAAPAFERTIAITHQEVWIEVVGADEGEDVRLQVWVDDEAKLDATGPVAPGNLRYFLISQR